MLRPGRPSVAAMEAALAEQSAAALTYTEVGATHATLPPGYQHDRYRRRLGTGEGAFGAACDGLRNWACHDGAGLIRVPERPELVPATTLVQAIQLGPVHVLAACRIVYVVDEPGRFGFAYGTLSLHAEQGEEAFLVSRDGDGEVWLDITVFSKPRHPLARLGWFAGRRVQVRATNCFLDGLEQHVRRTLA
jgi:uncharacterized protein (UPF0548 family)